MIWRNTEKSKCGRLMENVLQISIKPLGLSTFILRKTRLQNPDQDHLCKLRCYE